MMHLRAMPFLLLAAWAASVAAAQEAPMTPQAYDALFAAVNNAGRWGNADALGTLNHVTAEGRLAAAREIRTGISVSLSRTLEPGRVPGALEPVVVTPFAADDGGIHWELERLAFVYHGYAFSHVDALSHAAYGGHAYNAVSNPMRDRVRLSVERMQNGLISRGVLVDLPSLRGVEYLEPGTAYTPADMDAWEKKTGVTIGRGDVVLVRTGRWVRQKALGPVDPTKTQAGPHPTMARWLHERGVALVGDDGANDLAPSVVPGVSHAFHQLALVAMGMPLLDNLDLDALAGQCADARRWTFFFVGAPLPIKEGTGSPLNALAVF
jgi:kynurenine formamidase